MRHGMYSEESVAQGNGTYWWSTPDGGEVEISQAVWNVEDFKWQDAVDRGPVVEWVRSGRPERQNSKHHSPNLQNFPIRDDSLDF